MDLGDLQVYLCPALLSLQCILVWAGSRMQWASQFPESYIQAGRKELRYGGEKLGVDRHSGYIQRKQSSCMFQGIQTWYEEDNKQLISKVSWPMFSSEQ